MKKLSSTPDLFLRYAVLGSFVANGFALRPTFQRVVAKLLKDELTGKYPFLTAQFSRLFIAEPLLPINSVAMPANGQPQRFRYMSPIDVMIQSYIDSAPVKLTQGFHRLTLGMEELDPHPLAVNMSDLQSIINDWAPLLLEAYQQALAHFWCEVSTKGISPFQWLARSLQSSLTAAANDRDRVPALKDEQAVAFAALASFADKSQRMRLTEESPLHAYLVGVEYTEDGEARRLMMPGAVLVTRQMPEYLVILGYSLENGIEPVRALARFGADLRQRLQGTLPAPAFDWRLYEPEGDYFEALSLTLLEQQLRDFHDIGRQAQNDRWTAWRLEKALDEEGAMFPFFSRQEQPYLKHVLSKLPVWLREASPADLLDYSKLMLAQVIGQKQTGGKTFLDGIDTLPIFAEKMLKLAFERDHPGSTVNISQVLVDELGIEIPTIARVTENVTSLVDFMLSYQGGWPVGLIEVGDQRGDPLPGWLNSSYVKNLVDELDVGAQYIALIKRLLVDDVSEVEPRKDLFKSQISVQLSLLALEHKIRGEAGFTRAGWERVNHLMRPDSDLSASNVCLRPLGFYPYEGAEAHFVENMFVIGSIDTAVGPFILYRPFFPEPLLEFSNWPALLTAIQQEGELQHSILTWMSDDARAYYADGGFSRPHLEARLLEGFLALLPRSPATLVTSSVQGDYFEYLFDANARALMTLADKQSVSTSERRWALLKRSGWALFNGLTFFVSGRLQSAFWMFQTLLSIENTLQARLDGDKKGATQAIIDLLFNISLALLHRGLQFKARANDRLRLKAPIDEPMFIPDQEPNKPQPGPLDVKPSPPPRLNEKQEANLAEAEAVNFFDLDFSWFGPQSRLTLSQRADLDTFAVEVDLSLATRLDMAPLNGVLTYEGKSYVQMEGKTYRVQREPEGLIVQDDKQPERFGPRLIGDAAGQWRPDLRLGLKGGGPKKRIQALREEKSQKVEQLVKEADMLLDEVERTDRVLVITENLLQAASDRREQMLDRFESEINTWRRKIIQVLNLKARINNLVPLPDFEKKNHDTWVRLTLKLFRLQNYLEERLRTLPLHNARPDYAQGLMLVLQPLSQGLRGPYEEWVAHMKQAAQYEERLFKNALNESEALDEVKKRPLPKDSPLVELMSKPNRDYFDRHWVAAYLETLCELLIIRGSSNLTPEEQAAFNLFGQGSLVDSAWSQMSLRQYEVLNSSEHLDFLDSTLARYDAAQGICVNLMFLNSPHIRNDYLPSMTHVLGTLREFTQQQMAKVIHESESSTSSEDEPTPGPSREMSQLSIKPATQTGRQVFIKTTRNQTLVANTRSDSSGSEVDIVDVPSGISSSSSRAYRKTPAGDWEEITQPRPETLQATQVKTLIKLEAEARKMLGEFRDVIARTRASAGASRIPVEIQEILDFKAKSLDDVAANIERIAQSTVPGVEPLSDQRRTAVLATSFNLKSAAQRLHEEGKNLRISIIKRLAPTGPNVDYLNTQGEVNIVRVGERKHLSKGQRKDYLQEYAIRSPDGSDLWFAHLHYPALDTPAEGYTAAHLKTAQQRTLSEQALYARAKSPNEYIEVYRAKLDKTLVTKLFLSIV